MKLEELLASAQLRTEFALRQIEEIRRGEHTHPHPLTILQEVARQLADNREKLDRAVLTEDADVCRNAAADLIVDLNNYLPLFGFILRSSNVRNAFEVFDPLIEMCGALLGGEVRLIYSSEWDYSPFTRTFTFPKLSNVVVVGLPAHESGNSLVVPVFGHELGHAKWKAAEVLADLKGLIQGAVISYYLNNLDDVLNKKDAKRVRDETNPTSALSILIPEVEEAQRWATLQAEEVFCDIVGTRIFGTSYLRAFAYLIFPSPKQLERQSFRYPGNRARVDYLVSAAEHFSAHIPDEFGSDFDDTLSKKLDPARRHAVMAADYATEQVFQSLVSKVDELVTPDLIPKIDDTNVRLLKECFRVGHPGNGIFQLAEIIEAAWETYLEKIQNEREVYRVLSALNELVFKTVEVSEFYRRTAP